MNRKYNIVHDQKLYHGRSSPDHCKVYLADRVQYLHFACAVMGGTDDPNDKTKHNTDQHRKRCDDQRVFRPVKDKFVTVLFYKVQFKLINKFRQNIHHFLLSLIYGGRHAKRTALHNKFGFPMSMLSIPDTRNLNSPVSYLRTMITCFAVV